MDYTHELSSSTTVHEIHGAGDLVSINKKEYWLWFGAIVLAALLMRLACFTGLIASDDMDYSHYAQQISHQQYVPEAIHLALRHGLIVPVGIVYRLFGVTEWSTSMLPLAASTSSVLLLMMIARKLYGFRAALIVGLLYATFPLAVRYATILVPEPIAEFYILAAVLLLLHVQYKPSLLTAVIIGSVLGVAYLTKETAVFVAMAILVEAALSRRWQIFLGLVLGLTIVIGIEHAYYLTHTGDLLFRYHAMAGHNNIVAGTRLPASSAQSSIRLANHSERSRELLWHWFKAYPSLMLRPNIHLGLHSLFTLAVVLPAFVFRTPKSRLLVLWALLPFLYLSFGTTSFSFYIPIPVASRYIEFLYPPLFLLAGAAIDRCITSKPRGAVVSLCAIALVGAVGFFCAFSTRGEGWQTDEVKVLRVIVLTAKAKHLKIVRVEGERHRIWERAMVILGDGSGDFSKSEGTAVVIRPDASGLPFVAPEAERP